MTITPRGASDIMVNIRHSLMNLQVCLETLKELAVTDPRVVAHANGFRVLLAAAIDPANQVRRSVGVVSMLT